MKIVHYHEDIHDFILKYFSLFWEAINEMELHDQYQAFFRLVQSVQGSKAIKYVDFIVAKLAFLLENVEKVRDIEPQDGGMDAISCLVGVARILGIEKEVFQS